MIGKFLIFYRKYQSKRWFRFIVNRYVLSILIFIVWMMFFDKQNFKYYQNIKAEHDALVKDTLFYTQEIEQAAHQIKKIKGDKKELERFARETYFLKKDDEVIYVFLPDSSNSLE